MRSYVRGLQHAPIASMRRPTAARFLLPGLAGLLFFRPHGVVRFLGQGCPPRGNPKEYLKKLSLRCGGAILATGIMLLAFLCLFSGVILETVTRVRREAKRMAYLLIPAIGARRKDW